MGVIGGVDMHQGALDLMIEFAIGELASGDPDRSRALVRAMAHRWPEEKALMICFAMASAASQLEDIFATSQDAIPPASAYKMAALVAADILAIEEMGRTPACGRDLLHFWRRVDPYFLG